MSRARERHGSGGRRLTVGFDGRALTSPAAGVRRYTSELVRALLALGEPLDLVMLGGRVDAKIDGIPRVDEPPHPPTNAGWVLVGLPLAMRRAGVDLLHAPAYTAPFLRPAPVVLTIHDVSYARHPAWFPYRRDGVRRAFYRHSALRASLVITDSEFSAHEINAAYGIAPERIRVIPLGVDAAFTGGGTTSPPDGVGAPFALHVGDLHERRNLAMVVRALIEVRKRSAALATLSLVLAGVDRGIGASLRRLVADAGHADAVVILGSVEEDVLRALYGRASLLVYPSFYEGFGLPLVEAMASGVPVIASRAASIPEVVGDAGVLLDPKDESAWSTAIERVASDSGMAARLAEAGRTRAASFSWARTARLTLDVYRRAVEDGGAR